MVINIFIVIIGHIIGFLKVKYHIINSFATHIKIIKIIINIKFNRKIYNNNQFFYSINIVKKIGLALEYLKDQTEENMYGSR